MDVVKNFHYLEMTWITLSSPSFKALRIMTYFDAYFKKKPHEIFHNFWEKVLFANIGLYWLK